MADHRHKRDTNARRPRAVIIAAPLALVATASAVSLGVLSSEQGSADSFVAAPSSLQQVIERGPVQTREDVVSRNAARPSVAEAPTLERKPSEVEKLMTKASVRKAVDNADERLFTTEALNLWASPSDGAENLGEIDAGKKVLVTGRAFNEREELVIDGVSRWVTSGYLSAEKPEAEATLGGECTNGSSVPSGVSANIVKVHQAVCAAFPELTSYGTLRSDGEHSQGLAIDIMVSGSRGQEVADFVRENASALGVNYAIYAQQIWSVDRSSEGWRGMSDRGSTTANHYDHVHVTTY